jgi:hypothetical protein
VFTIEGCGVSWRACLQSTIAQSIAEAEYITIYDACNEVIWLKGLYVELSEDTSCIDLFCDIHSDIYLIKDQIFHKRTKHINVKYHYVRAVIAEGRLKVSKINTHDNPTNMIIKPVFVATQT